MCHTLRARITKSEAARVAGVSRRTVIRYAQAGLITSDRKGRIRVRELIAALGKPAGKHKKGRRIDCRPNAFRLVKEAGTHTSPHRMLAIDPSFPEFVQLGDLIDRAGGISSAANRRLRMRKSVSKVAVLLQRARVSMGSEAVGR